jgi:hypothetical protein
MAHCPPALLDDVADAVADLRTWAGVVERKPYVFYVNREPFLHFHLLEGRRRRADIKGQDDWVHVDLPEPLPAAARARFMRELRRHYRERRRDRPVRANASHLPRARARNDCPRPGPRL